jgi:hypothetical protein
MHTRRALDGEDAHHGAKSLGPLGTSDPQDPRRRRRFRREASPRYFLYATDFLY